MTRTFTRSVWIGDVSPVGSTVRVLFRGKRFPQAQVIAVRDTDCAIFKLVTFRVAS